MVTEPNLDKNDGTEPKARKKEKKKKKERRAEKESVYAGKKKEKAAAALPASARRAAQSAVVTAAEVRKRPREETLSAKAPKLPEPPEHSPAADASEAAAADQPKPSLEEAEAAAGRTMHKDSREAAEAAITQGRRVYVSNLPFSTSDEWVRTSFSAVESIHWIAAKGSGFRGSGFLTFASAEAATEAGLLPLRPLAVTHVRDASTTPRAGGELERQRGGRQTHHSRARPRHGAARAGSAASPLPRPSSRGPLAARPDLGQISAASRLLL